MKENIWVAVIIAPLFSTMTFAKVEPVLQLEDVFTLEYASGLYGYS
jgi:DNA-binding XRE family transcriptional regulator